MQEIALDGELIASEGEDSWEAKAEAEGTWSIFLGPKAAEEHQRNAAKEYQRGRDRREVRLWKHGRAFSPSAWFGNETSEWCGRAGWTDSGCRPRYGRKLPEPIPNISTARWREPSLGREAERELIRRAQAGDQSASEVIFRHFHRTIISVANSTSFDVLGWDERMQVGAEGLHAAVMKFNLKRPERFAGQFAEKYIRGFLQDAKRAARKDGMQDVPDRRSKGGEVWVVNLRTEYDEILAVGDAEEDGDNARAVSSARRIVGEASRGALLDFTGSDRSQRSGGTQSNPFLAERLHLDGIQIRILTAAGYQVAHRDLPFVLDRMADSEGRSGRRAVPTDHLYPQSLGKVYPAEREKKPVRNVDALRTELRAVWATRFELVRKSKERRLRAARKRWVGGNPWTVEVYAAGPGEIRAGENGAMQGRNRKTGDWKIIGWRAAENARRLAGIRRNHRNNRHHVPDSYSHSAAKRKARLVRDMEVYQREREVGSRLIPRLQQASP